MRLLVSGLLTLTLVAGCGGDTIPLAEYVERADDICRDVKAKTNALVDEAEDAGGAGAERKFLQLNQQGRDRIHELPTPSERQEDAQAFEQTLDDVIASLEDAAEAALERDDKAHDAALQRNQDSAKDWIRAAEDLGMKDCGQTAG
jgi:uncharacterized alpha-E superfamily protein